MSYGSGKNLQKPQNHQFAEPLKINRCSLQAGVQSRLPFYWYDVFSLVGDRIESSDDGIIVFQTAIQVIAYSAMMSNRSL